MKQLSAFTLIILFSIGASSKSRPGQLEHKVYFGKVSQLIVKAMSKAGVRPRCDKSGCSFLIKDFYSYVETDSCGGGTTGYGVSFTFSDGKNYEEFSCDGSDFPPRSKTKGSELASIFQDLGLAQTSGWTSSIEFSKIECVTGPPENSEDSAAASCQLLATDP